MKIQDDWGEQHTAAIVRGRVDKRLLNSRKDKEGTGPTRTIFFSWTYFFPSEKKKESEFGFHNQAHPGQIQEPETCLMLCFVSHQGTRKLIGVLDYSKVGSATTHNVLFPAY